MRRLAWLRCTFPEPPLVAARPSRPAEHRYSSSVFSVKGLPLSVRLFCGTQLLNGGFASNFLLEESQDDYSAE